MKMKHPFKKGKKIGYRGSVTMPCLIMPTRRLRGAPIESIMKVVLPFIALLIEAYTGFKFYEQRIPILSNNTTTSTTTTTTTSSAEAMVMGHEHNHDHAHAHNHASHSDANVGNLEGSYRIVRTWAFAHGNGKKTLTLS
jgi:hypothetical protein